MSKDAFDEMTPLAFIVVRFLLMTTLAFGVLVVSARGDRSLLKIDRSDLPQFVLVGITGYTFYQLGFVFGVEKTSAFSSALLISMQPLFTMLILAKRGEPTPQYGWIGLGIAVTGVAIFMLDKRGGVELCPACADHRRSAVGNRVQRIVWVGETAWWRRRNGRSRRDPN